MRFLNQITCLVFFALPVCGCSYHCLYGIKNFLRQNRQIVQYIPELQIAGNVYGPPVFLAGYQILSYLPNIQWSSVLNFSTDNNSFNILGKIDRNDIDKVLTEQNFQMSGYVDDDAFVSIGKFIGANVVVTGNITGTGSQKRMVIKAIDVLTSEILSMASVSL